MVVRTEPHEPRLIGRGVGYWRIGAKLPESRAFARLVQKRKHPRIEPMVRLRSTRAHTTMLRTRDRWWKRNSNRPGWSFRYHFSTQEARHQARRLKHLWIFTSITGFGYMVGGLSWAFHIYDDTPFDWRSSVLLAVAALVWPGGLSVLAIVDLARRNWDIQPCFLNADHGGVDIRCGNQHLQLTDWSQFQDIRTRGSFAEVLTPCGWQHLMISGAPRVSLIDLACRLNPDVRAARRRRGWRLHVRFVLYAPLAYCLGAGLLWFLGEPDAAWDLLILACVLGLAVTTLLLVVQFTIKWKCKRDRRRTHAANRQISTTPLPSPTTPEDPQT